MKKGFSLIELLVVIAIIGILSTIVLASLNEARNKASNSSVMSNLSNLRSQAQILYENNGNYTAGFCTNPTIVPFIDAAKAAANITTATVVSNSTAGATGVTTCHGYLEDWVIESPLKSPIGYFHCVDSTGASVTTSVSTVGTNDPRCN